MVEKVFRSNIVPTLSSGNHLFYKAEYMRRSCLNEVLAITFDWSALVTWSKHSWTAFWKLFSGIPHLPGFGDVPGRQAYLSHNSTWFTIFQIRYQKQIVRRWHCLVPGARCRYLVPEFPNFHENDMAFFAYFCHPVRYQNYFTQMPFVTNSTSVTKYSLSDVLAHTT